MLKYTVWKSYNNNDMEEIFSTDLLSEVAQIWHNESNKCYDDYNNDFTIVVTNNLTDECLSENFLHLAYLSKMDTDYKLSIELEAILEAMYTEEIDDETLNKAVNDSKNILN